MNQLIAPQYVYQDNEEGKEPENACTYYRIQVPLSCLKEQYDMKIFRRHNQDSEIEAVTAGLASDIYHVFSLTGPGILHRVNTIQKMKAAIQGDGRVKLPPSVIWDCDDNADFVHPINTSYAMLGVRAYPSLKLLEPGDMLMIKDEEGRTIKCWEDKVTKNGDGKVFDIERNLKWMAYRHEIMRRADGVTTASPILSSYIKDVIGVKNVYTFPNTIIPDQYKEYTPRIERPNEVRVLWQGSMSHWVDWYPLREAVKTITDKYPQVKWVIFGEWFNWIGDVIPENRIERIDWVPYEAYRIRRSLIHADINLAPLADNVFNRSKSAIKWYEASIWSKPEVTLASNVGAYKDEMTDGKDSLLFSSPEEFVQKLSRLIEDADLRSRLAANAKEWVLANRTPEKTIPGLYEFYTEMRKRRVHQLFQSATDTVKQLALAEGYTQ